ncbi:MAG: anthranilate synthase component I [Bifidobacteriaceae bacterium]|jgi:anthranilate synthase component 1|nr:anthranilate synthase component I [Bifidobacteriaceae bacterium]
MANTRSAAATPAPAPAAPAPNPPTPLPLGATWPDQATFLELAARRERRVIPVVRRLLADGETPVGLYRKLADSRPGTFLFESAEHGGLFSRYSFIGADSQATLTADRDGRARWLGRVPAGVPTEGQALDVAEQTLALLRTPRLPGLPPLTGGLVGVVSYDAVRHWERVPELAQDELCLPDVSLVFATDLAVLDHRDASVWLIANAVNQDGTDARAAQAWEEAAARLDRMEAALAAAAPSTVALYDAGARPEAVNRTSREAYLSAVEAGKAAIRDGEVFQVVIAQRFDLATQAAPLDVYRVLRATNPSPYMYFYAGQAPAGGGFAVVGSSPEALVTAQDGLITTHPIAGTRPRGRDPESDRRLAAEMLADPKERAEHVMLVDLARNDLARVSEPGSVEVVEFMEVERYSHVMHIVSTVIGRQRGDASAYEVLRATFPAGTLSGAPKPRAMELIESLEPARRGVYGGTVGYLDFAGDLDMAIAIRTAVVKDGRAHVAAGAGIVADSDPENEYRECQHKAAAALTAVALAGTMRQAGAAAPTKEET